MYYLKREHAGVFYYQTDRTRERSSSVLSDKARLLNNGSTA